MGSPAWGEARRELAGEQMHSSTGFGARRWLALAVIAGGLAFPQGAKAHGSGLSYLDLSVDGPTVAATLDISARDVAESLRLDVDGNGYFDRRDLDAAGPLLGRWMIDSIRLVAGGKLCRGAPAFEPELQADTLLILRTNYTCEGEVDQLNVYLRLKDTLGEGHPVVVRAVRGEHAHTALLDDRNSSASFDLSTSSALDAAGQFFVLGVEHIFTGIDHVLFVLSLLLIGGRLRRVIGLATAFTVAHSVTLSLAALEVVSLSSRLVETMIAVSIGWIALENYLYARERPPGAPEPLGLRLRWLLVFAFGLMHGFGFADILIEGGLPPRHVAVALGSFNLGVELGQIAIIAVAWPLLQKVGRMTWYRPRAVQVASVGTFAAAVYWFVERALG